MKKWIKITLWGIGGVISVLIISITILIFLFVTQNERDNRNPARKKEMIEITLKWGRFAPFPQEAENFNIYTEGGAFTRTFKGSFTAPKEIIEKWVEQSPGLQDAKIEIISNTKKKYLISPDGGSAYAEVIIDYRTGKVEFQTYWS